MKIFMIGGTGLLGSAGAAELIARGHPVRSLALPPVPPGSLLPPAMDLIFGNYLDLGDDDLLRAMGGCDAFVFAAGVDERVEGPPPIYDLFYRNNIAPLDRLLKLAKRTTIRRAVILGSYFTTFARQWPECRLADHHPYIRSRVEQARLALSLADDRLSVCILELPYIFGAQPGRRPVWVFLAEQLLAMPGLAFYPGGGTAMVTVRQVGQAIAGAVERGESGRQYPVGWFNLTWVEMLRIFYRHMGQPDKKIVTVPRFLFRLQTRRIMAEKRRQNLEPGLDLVTYADFMTAKTFISREISEKTLGVQDDDLDEAIGQSVRLCLDIIQGRAAVIGMKAGTDADQDRIGQK